VILLIQQAEEQLFLKDKVEVNMTAKEFILSKLDKLKLVGLCIKSVTAVIGGSLILTEGHPYTTLCVLAVGAIANEVVSFIKEKENDRDSDSKQ
jgi:hypothetical protein